MMNSSRGGSWWSGREKGRYQLQANAIFEGNGDPTTCYDRHSPQIWHWPGIDTDLSFFLTTIIYHHNFAPMPWHLYATSEIVAFLSLLS